MNRKAFNSISVFSIQKEIFKSDITLLEEYISDVSEKFETRSISIRSNFFKEIEEFEMNYFEDQYFKNALYFPKILNASHLISLYSLLETTMKEILIQCRRIYMQGEFKKQKGWSQLKYYVEELFSTYQISSAKNVGLFEKLDEYRIVRNLFVHDNGNITLLSDSMKVKVRSIVNLSNGDLILNENYNELIIYRNTWLMGCAQLAIMFLDPVFDELILKHNQFIRGEITNVGSSGLRH